MAISASTKCKIPAPTRTFLKHLRGLQLATEPLRRLQRDMNLAMPLATEPMRRAQRALQLATEPMMRMQRAINSEMPFNGLELALERTKAINLDRSRTLNRLHFRDPPKEKSETLIEFIKDEIEFETEEFKEKPKIGFMR